MQLDYKIAKDVAIKEVLEFVEQFSMDEQSETEVCEAFPQVIQAVRLGLLELNAETPVLKLKDPVMTENNTEALSTVKFKTRMTFSDKKRLSSGINMQKDRYEYFGRVMSFAIGEPVAMLDKIKPFDLKVIEQLSTLFI